VPAGASILAPVGTAPGLVVPVAGDRGGPPVVVLPGPPWELRQMWPAALADPVVQAALAGRAELRQQTIRLWGTPEAELAATLRVASIGPDGRPGLTGLEITTCLRQGELEIVTRFGPDAQASYDDLVRVVSASYPDALFSTNGHTIDEVVAQALIAGGRTIATAESCTAGLLAGRLADLPGSSAYLLGGLVVYANEAKQELAGVPAQMIESVGAVSAEVAQALAVGARTRLGADIGVGITGIAGPDGGSPEKPVGLVHLCVDGLGQTVSRQIILPGSRADIRHRAVIVALHLIRELLAC
jgi:nicotinamide-nucleotide amidase